MSLADKPSSPWRRPLVFALQQQQLTVCHPAMLAALTLPPLQLPRFEAVTVAVHQSAADSLSDKKNTQIHMKVVIYHFLSEALSS